MGTKIILDSACTLKHSAALRETFLASGAPEVARYQHDLQAYLEKLCSDADIEIGKVGQRLQAQQALDQQPRVRPRCA